LPGGSFAFYRNKSYKQQFRIPTAYLLNLFMNQTEFRPKSEEIPGQQLPYPARQSDMNPAPDTNLSNYKPAGKLTDKVAIITGADSGIGRAVAIAFAMEGAKVAIVYNENTGDAAETKRLVESKGGTCLVIQTDVRSSENCKAAVQQTVDHYGKLNILVNNAAFQMAQEKLEDITEEQLRRSFDTNIIAYFFMAQAALPHLHEGDAIVNTGSIVGIVGNPILVDYTATKGAIHAFTKSLAIQLGKRNIRVNCVAPGPVWTPNIPGTMPEDEVKNFGHEVALARPGQPEELAPAYVMLASSDGSFMTGSIVEVTGGKLG
jgi:NAD(P)-dependent dehydrogenase (short-subunit alcohol dehydrogenase family)